MSGKRDEGGGDVGARQEDPVDRIGQRVVGRPLVEQTLRMLLEQPLTRNAIKPFFANLTIGAGAAAAVISRDDLAAPGALRQLATDVDLWRLRSYVPSVSSVSAEFHAPTVAYATSPSWS